MSGFIKDRQRMNFDCQNQAHVLPSRLPTRLVDIFMLKHTSSILASWASYVVMSTNVSAVTPVVAVLIMVLGCRCECESFCGMHL